ncbi:MAG: nuclear transport factor 2 family protein [Magnetococcales bacterium]|nr:nuclear transport factor 2 family protein [Magnetococcales bacterium]
MLTEEVGQRFAETWIEAWNSRNLEMLAALYTDDFIYCGPYIGAVMGIPSDYCLKGIDSVRDYWQKALEKAPDDMHFELKGVYIGVDSLVIHYRGAFGRDGCQMFHFNEDGVVFKATSHYDRI